MGVQITIPKLVKDLMSSVLLSVWPHLKESRTPFSVPLTLLPEGKKKKSLNYYLSSFWPHPEPGLHLRAITLAMSGWAWTIWAADPAPVRLFPSSNLSPDRGWQGLVSVHHCTFSLNFGLPSSWLSQILILLSVSLFLLLAWPSDLTHDTVFVATSLVFLIIPLWLLSSYLARWTWDRILDLSSKAGTGELGL